MRFRLTILLTFLISIFGQAQESPEYSLSLEGSLGIFSNQQKTLEPYSWQWETYEFEPQLIEARPLWNTTGISFSRRKNNWEFGIGIRSFNLKYYRDSIQAYFENVYGEGKVTASHILPFLAVTKYFKSKNDHLFFFTSFSFGYFRLFERYYPNAHAYNDADTDSFNKYNALYQNNYSGYDFSPSPSTFDFQFTGGVQYKIQRWSANIGLSYYHLHFEHSHDPYFSFNHGLYISGKLGFRLNKIE